MKNPELVFVPSPGAGHLTAALEAAKLLLDRDGRLSITILILKRPSDTKYMDSLLDTFDRLQLINLPDDDSIPFGPSSVEKYKSHIKEAVSKLPSRSDSSLAGFILDMFCHFVIDVANEFGVPSYIIFTSDASFLGFLFHLQALHDEHGVDPTEFKGSDAEIECPSLINPFPARVLPPVALDKERLPLLLSMARKFREAKGILVNSFVELESHALNSFSDGTFGNVPPVYPVGPILNIKGIDDLGSGKSKEIMDWLDHQPHSSVVFLCFGSMGSFREDQAKEIAIALENSGRRFLWSLRKPSATGQMMDPLTEYENLEEVLPSGFLDRTAGIGKIVGWAPQVAILAHSAIGGFVCHCGWNSTLESIWYGVPIATWPMYAEQQYNAFLMVRELGLGVEITMVYSMDSDVIVKAEDIERGIRSAMEEDSEIRKRVKEISEVSRKVLMDGGSSFSSLNRFIHDVIHNMP